MDADESPANVDSQRESAHKLIELFASLLAFNLPTAQA
jgi:hypothetical protein